MQTDFSNRPWWYRLLAILKRKFFSDDRWFAQASAWFRRVGYPRLVVTVYLPLKRIQGQVWKSVFSQDQWCRLRSLPKLEIPRNLLLPQNREDSFVPALYCCLLDQACIQGGSNFVMVEGALLHHDLYAFETDFSSEENYFRLVFEPGFRRAAWIAEPKISKSLNSAAVFTDGCSGNYAHWLTEVLPRIASFCEDERFKVIPVVVDQGLHANIQASLRLVIGEHRVVHEIAAGELFHVERLYWMSAAGYVPYERRAPSAYGHGQGIFSPYALGITRAICLKAIDASPSLSTSASGSKIYLKRNSQVRRLLNAEALETYLKSQGFEVVEPEKLSFLEQVKLFSQASCIVGPTGAAFANLIFAPLGARIVVLMGQHPDTSYDYWDNIAKAVGLQVECLLGDMIDLGRGIHSDFSIDIAALDGALRGH